MEVCCLRVIFDSTCAEIAASNESTLECCIAKCIPNCFQKTRWAWGEKKEKKLWGEWTGGKRKQDVVQIGSTSVFISSIPWARGKYISWLWATFFLPPQQVTMISASIKKCIFRLGKKRKKRITTAGSSTLGHPFFCFYEKRISRYLGTIMDNRTGIVLARASVLSGSC